MKKMINSSLSGSSEKPSGTRPRKRTKGLILVPLLVLIMVFTAACGSAGSNEKESSDSADKSKNKEKATSSVTYNYVSPSKLSDSSDSDSDAASNDSVDSQEDPGEQGGPGSQGGGPGGPDTQNYDFSGSYSATLTADGNGSGEKNVSKDGVKISSKEKDKNAVLATNGGTLTLTGAQLTKSGSDNEGDGCNFYGINSSLLAVGEKTKAYISGSTISSTSDGSNGIFATDSAKVYVGDVKITTKDSDNARGLDATYGGVIYGDKLDISTQGEHCAAIATDRGGGYISVTNSSLKTAGSGSPLIYSTGDIEIDNTTGTAGGSQIAGMEGLNRIIINNSTLESTNDALTGSDPIKNGVIIYQSTSGDADTKTDEKADFEAIDSTLKTNISDGAMFYVTNTDAKILLQNTKLDFDSAKVDLLNATGNSSNNWGSSGSNGGDVRLTCKDQTIKGDIKIDSISSVDMTLAQGSEYTGAFKGDVTDDNSCVSVSKDSTWVVTKNCTISSLAAEDGAKIVDKNGKTVTIKANGKTAVEGESEITVTVKGDYGTKIDDDASEVTTVDVLDRSAFDKKYEGTTSFGKND